MLCLENSTVYLSSLYPYCQISFVTVVSYLFVIMTEALSEKKTIEVEPRSDNSPDSRDLQPAVLKDGQPVHPQPTSDPLDPLNWTFARKHAILSIVALKYFLFTYLTTTV